MELRVHTNIVNRQCGISVTKGYSGHLQSSTPDANVVAMFNMQQYQFIGHLND